MIDYLEHVKVMNSPQPMSGSDDITIFTHPGLFHADEIFAIASAILALYDDGRKFNIVRTRTPDNDWHNSLYIDIGGRDKPIAGQFDHHQKGFIRARNNDVKYAAAGLVWDYYGMDSVWEIAGDDDDDTSVMQAYIDLDKSLFSAIDATDNGQHDLVSSTLQVPTISHIVSSFNPHEWDVDNDERNAAFMDALHFTMGYLVRSIKTELHRARTANEVIRAAGVAKEGIMFLSKGMPWINVVMDCWGMFEHIQVCVYPGSGENDWRVQSLPGVRNQPMTSRCPAPESWRGLRGEELQIEARFDDLEFVHNSGFIGGATTRDAAMGMAGEWVAIVTG